MLRSRLARLPHLAQKKHCAQPRQPARRPWGCLADDDDHDGWYRARDHDSLVRVHARRAVVRRWKGSEDRYLVRVADAAHDR